MAELNINELQRRSEITKYGRIVSPRLVEFKEYGESGGDPIYETLGKRLAEGDGIALNSAAHPRPVWYMRPYWWLRCWLKR